MRCLAFQFTSLCFRFPPLSYPWTRFIITALLFPVEGSGQTWTRVFSPAPRPLA